VRELAHIGHLDALPKLLTLAASQTARLANLSQLASAFELSRPTIRNYLTLMERLFLVEFLPPWFSNRAKRLIKGPKLHFGDTGLACSLLRCGAAELYAQRALLGQLLKTFVFGEVAKQAAAHPERMAGSSCTTAITYYPLENGCSLSRSAHCGVGSPGAALTQPIESGGGLEPPTFALAKVGDCVTARAGARYLWHRSKQGAKNDSQCHDHRGISRSPYALASSFLSRPRHARTSQGDAPEG
jgi:hypothetical protein